MAAVVTRRRVADSGGIVETETGPGPKNPNIPDARGARMTIRVAGGDLVLAIPYAPSQVDYGGRARGWVEVARPLDTPILSTSGKPLPTISFELFLGHPNARRNVKPLLDRLEGFAGSKKRLHVKYSSSEAGLWHLTDFTYQSLQRHEVTNEIVRATASLTFTRVSEWDAKVGPVKGGHHGGGRDDGKVPDTYTVKRGDTLHSIAVKIYDDPKMWRAIADENKIRHPRDDAKLKPGTKLKMPKRRKGGKGKDD